MEIKAIVAPCILGTLGISAPEAARKGSGDVKVVVVDQKDQE
jgi:hypothetical protein